MYGSNPLLNKPLSAFVANKDKSKLHYFLLNVHERGKNGASRETAKSAGKPGGIAALGESLVGKSWWPLEQRILADVCIDRGH